MAFQKKSKTQLINELKTLHDRIKQMQDEGDGHFDALLEHIPMPIFICQTDGKLIDCSTTMAERLNYEKRELIGIPFVRKELFFEEDLPRARYKIEQAGKGKSSEPDEFRLRSHNGSVVYVSIVVYPVSFSDQTLLLGIARDITQEKLVDEERKGFETQFRQAQKMEAIGTLAGGIAHDLNNILSPIMVHAELALFDLPEDSPLCANMEEILSASDRARDLIGQILLLSHQGEEEPILLKVTPIVKEALKLLRMSLPTTIRIHQDLALTTDSVLADPSQVHQVLMNLCTNAGHAMREKGGELKVILKNVQVDSDMLPAFPGLIPGPFIKLSIRDTGHGMAPAALDRIFDPYYTTKQKGQGRGFGLPTVLGIINHYGGAIRVSSKPEKGTTVDVFFPEAESEPDDVSLLALPLPKGEESILLVDDDISLLSSLQTALAKLGYSVTAHASSREALEMFTADPMQFDLVITDQTMPYLTGEELSREILSRRPGIPIVLCTGYSEIFTAEQARATGIREYVMKPIALHKMAAILRTLLDSE